MPELCLNRASKSCRHADAHLRNNFEKLRKICTFEHKTRKTDTFLKGFAQFDKFLKFYMFLWYFEPIPVRKIFSYKILPAQIFLLLECLCLRYAQGIPKI